MYFLDANFVQFLSCDMWSSIFSLNVLGRWQKVKPKGVRVRLRELVGLRQTLTNIRDFDWEKMIAYDRWLHTVASNTCLLLARHAILPKPFPYVRKERVTKPKERLRGWQRNTEGSAVTEKSLMSYCCTTPLIRLDFRGPTIVILQEWRWYSETPIF